MGQQQIKYLRDKQQMTLKCQGCLTVKEIGFYSICKVKSHPATVSRVLTEYMRFLRRDNDVIAHSTISSQSITICPGCQAPVPMGKCEEAQVTPPD